MVQEISLREIIEALFRGKWIIAGTTVLAILISGAFSYFVITPTYETEVTIMINQIKENEPSDFGTYVSGLVTPTIYAEQIKAPELLDRVVKSEELKGYSWTSGNLRSALNIEISPESNLVKVKLQGNNPEDITMILNTLINYSTVYTGERIGEKVDLLLDEYEVQMHNIQKKLNEAIQEYNQLKAGSGLPSLILFQESVTDESKFVIEANKEILDDLQNIDKGKQVEFIQISEKIKNLTELYNSYNIKYEEAQSLSSSALAKNTINPIVNAVAPESAISPNKQVNIAVGAVLGLIAGVIIAFIYSYLRNPAKRKPHASRKKESGSFSV